MCFALSSLPCPLMLSLLPTPNLVFLLTIHLKPAKSSLWYLLRLMTPSQYFQFALCYRSLLRGTLLPALTRRGTFSPPKTLFLHHLGIQAQRGMSQTLLHLPPTPNHTIPFLCHQLLLKFHLKYTYTPSQQHPRLQGFLANLYIIQWPMIWLESAEMRQLMCLTYWATFPLHPVA